MQKDKRYLFVDGYNIINAWSDLFEMSKASLQIAREKLIEMMAEYKAYTGVEVIVVFDAHLVKNSMRNTEKHFDVKVVYTKERETADSYIEKEVVKLGKRKNIRVATSDKAEQEFVFGSGATRVSAREFKIEYQNLKKNMTKKRKTKQEKQKKNELSDFLDEETLKKLEAMLK